MSDTCLWSVHTQCGLRWQVDPRLAHPGGGSTQHLKPVVPLRWRPVEDEAAVAGEPGPLPGTKVTTDTYSRTGPAPPPRRTPMILQVSLPFMVTPPLPCL